jgi:hypothetical protein
MLATESSRTDSGEVAADVVGVLWQELRSHLDDKRNVIYEEIKHYPPPIPACDQQFNYLLEQRIQIHQELRRVKTILKQSLAPDDTVKKMEEFMQSSAFVDAEVKHHIRSRLQRL